MTMAVYAAENYIEVESSDQTLVVVTTVSGRHNRKKHPIFREYKTRNPWSLAVSCIL